jgi:putative transposase
LVVSIREVLTVKKAAYSPEQIVVKMREIDKIAATDDVGVAVAAKRVGIADHMHARWHKKYDAMPKADVKRLKEVERENARLQRLLASREVDNSILPEVAQGRY